jgi:hypothetical protein
LVEEILWDIETEHRTSHLDYQADHAAQHVAWLHVATRSFDRFVPTAERLGSDWWIPVTALAETAIAAGHRARRRGLRRSDEPRGHSP